MIKNVFLYFPPLCNISTSFARCVQSCFISEEHTHDLTQLLHTQYVGFYFIFITDISLDNYFSTKLVARDAFWRRGVLIRYILCTYPILLHSSEMKTFHLASHGTQTASSPLLAWKILSDVTQMALALPTIVDSATSVQTHCHTDLPAAKTHSSRIHLKKQMAISARSSSIHCFFFNSGQIYHSRPADASQQTDDVSAGAMSFFCLPFLSWQWWLYCAFSSSL